MPIHCSPDLILSVLPESSASTTGPEGEMMIELPVISSDFARSVIQNFTIVATLVLLYSFIPDSVLSRSKLSRSLSVGIVFGFAAILSIPTLWENGTGPAVGFNLALVPLAGYAGGPVASAIVAAILLIGSTGTNGALSPVDTMTIMSGLLVGAFVYRGCTWSRFPRQVWIHLVIIGAGVSLVELLASSVSAMITIPSGGPPQGAQVPVSITPFIVMSFAVTIVLGSIIVYIDRKRQAERELLDYKNHLEALVEDRTAALQKSEEKYRSFVENASEIVFSLDLSGIFTYISPNVRDLMGYAPDDITGRQAEIFVHPEDYPRNRDFFREVIASGARKEGLEYRIRHKDGTWHWFSQSFMPMKDADGRVIRIYGICHDVTERKAIESAVISANTKLNLLSTLTRHDILNQLTALMAYVELAETKSSAHGEDGHFDAIKKILDVIRLQLEFSRDYQEVGLKKPGWVRVDHAFLTATGSFADRTTSFSCDTDSLEIFSDPMISQVFHNLIDNSLRHGEHVSGIRLSAARDNHDILIIYEDNGAGVLPEEKERIFQKGFGKHTGLGMFLIREILSITDITITETGTYGAGARFLIRVPEGKFRFTS